MNIEITKILTQWGIPALVGGLASFFVTSWRTHILSSELENLRHKLRRIEMEREVRFKELQKRRLEMLDQIHSDLVDAFRAVTKLMTVRQGEEFSQVRVANYRAASTTTREFIEKFEKQKIYLSEQVSKQVEELVQELWKETLKFHWLISMCEQMEPPKGFTSRDDAWLKSWDNFEKRFPPVLKAVQNEFRELLGVEGSNK